MEQYSDDMDEDKTNESLNAYSDLSPLHIACWKGKESKLKIYLKKYKDVNVTDKDKRTPLHLACVQGFSGGVKKLIENNANVNIRDIQGHTPIFKAVEAGHINIVKMLVEAGSDLVIRDYIGDTVLHKAIKYKFTNIASILINNSVYLDVVNDENQTPLHCAASMGLTETVKALVDRGAATDVLDEKNKTPFIIACEKGYRDIINILRRNTELHSSENQIVYLKKRPKAEENYEKEYERNQKNEEYTNLFSKNLVNLKNKPNINNNNMNYSSYESKHQNIMKSYSIPRNDLNTLKREYDYDLNSSVSEEIAKNNTKRDTVDKVSNVMSGLMNFANQLEEVKSILERKCLLEGQYRNKIQVLQSNLLKIQEEKEELGIYERDVKGQVTSLENDLNSSLSLLHYLQTEVDKLKNRLKHERDAYEKLKHDSDKLKQKEDECCQILKSLEIQIEEAKSQKKAAEIENASLNNEINLLKAEAENKQEELNDWQRKFTEINNEKHSLEMRVDILKKDLNLKQKSLDSCIHSNEQKLQALQAEKESIEKKLVLETRKRTISEKKLSVIEQELQDLKTNYGSAKKELNQLQQCLEEQSSSHSNSEKILRTQVENLTADNMALCSRVNELREVLKHAETEFQKEQIESNQIISNLQNELKQYDQYFDRTKSNNSIQSSKTYSIHREKVVPNKAYPK
ncbi:ankyrin repeat domain-containing protein 18A-like [Centruroides sculpturatus]|uniref:ankyrin repeat domain-containing protein 18A-like n=1 Tax=Centruroides sculpturatus TaxID=218467 RepID=UPI000C6CFD29|nr:ankyrin repeat domain-containing protein 18A-like [Centruroides sculpturatus]